jgi:site-specific DNA recombinase
LGYEVFGVYEDKSVSGGIRNRPGLNDAIANLKNGMVLVVDRSDRLARDMLILLTIHHQVESIGCTIEFADGSPLRSTPESKLYSNILGAFAQYEREKFSLRTKRGLQKKRDAGIWLGKPPVGMKLDRNTKQLVVNDVEKRAMDFSIRLMDRNLSSEKVATLVTKRHGPLRGREWSARTIRKIYANRPKPVIDNSAPE